MTEDGGSPPPRPAPSERIGVRLGERYLLGELLGVGGSAAVYAAEDLWSAIPSRVAVKVMHPHLCTTDQLRQAFLREADRAAQVRHPNIVAVRGSGLHDAGGIELAWIAFDLVEGPTLTDWVDARGPLPPTDAVAVVEGLLAALGAAHAAGLVHRDVAPRNVVLERADPALLGPFSPAMVRLLDFGLADGSGRTTIGNDVLLADASGGGVVGNVAFVSPEQASGDPVTYAGDLYQSGALLYYLLTGRPPFPRGRVSEVLAAHLAAPPPAPSALVASARPLDPVVTTAMAKDPAHRYRDADAFRDALVGALPRPNGSARSSQPAATRVLPLASVARSSSAGPAPATPAPRAAMTRSRAEELPDPAGPSPIVLGAAATVAVAAVMAALGAAPASVPTVAPSPSPSVSAARTPSPTPSPRRSTPPSVRAVPELDGTLAQASATLRAAGFQLGRVTRVASARGAGTVLSQEPGAGVRAARGSTVDLVVASGRNLVPDVTGLSIAAAVELLTEAGFSPQADLPAVTSDLLVTGSEPVADATARVGTVVTLVLETEASDPPAPSEPGTATPTGP